MLAVNEKERPLIESNTYIPFHGYAFKIFENHKNTTAKKLIIHRLKSK